MLGVRVDGGSDVGVVGGGVHVVGVGVGNRVAFGGVVGVDNVGGYCLLRLSLYLLLLLLLLRLLLLLPSLCVVAAVRFEVEGTVYACFRRRR